MGLELSKVAIRSSSKGSSSSSNNTLRRVGSSGELARSSSSTQREVIPLTTNNVLTSSHIWPPNEDMNPYLISSTGMNATAPNTPHGSGSSERRNSLNANSTSGRISTKTMENAFTQAISRRKSTNRYSISNSPASSASTTMNTSIQDDQDYAVEALDISTVEWEGYVTKRGHLVRNWKVRFFTLEGNLLSYYETKVEARNRSHLKGRVHVTSVNADRISRSGQGFEFTFNTMEGKVFHCSVATPMEQLAWVYFLEAGVDTNNLRNNLQPQYTSSGRVESFPRLKSQALYTLYARCINGELHLVNELLSHFNKDVVFSASYPSNTPFHGDFFGREGFLHFLGAVHHNMEVLEFTLNDITMDADGKSFTLKGHEKIRSRHSRTIIFQPWTHRIRFCPYGRILRLKVDVDVNLATGDWKSFAMKSPHSEMSETAVRSTRSLSISLKDFTVYNVIGKGGFGTVVNAVKKSDGQIYALKILEKSRMTKYDIESSFTEMRVAQNIHHPFIAGLRIAFQSRTKLFLGMNYYGGGDLFHHMSKGTSCRIAPERALFYTAELVLGLHHLHQHDILYRDIKPENVMIDGEGHIALVDFGLAKLHVSDYKGAKTMAGSPQYTAPELLLPKAKRSYGKAADWWSLGILLYEMSVGKSPFYDSNVDKMYKRIQNDPLTFPSRPELSESLKDILRRFLQKDATKRLGVHINDILEHSYFGGIDWGLLLQKKLIPPWKPNLQSPLDVEYVDTEFTDLDVEREVLSPTDRGSRSKGFLSAFSGSRKSTKSTPPIQDPTFKDFTYYYEDPDKLVQVNNLVSELKPLSSSTSNFRICLPDEQHRRNKSPPSQSQGARDQYEQNRYNSNTRGNNRQPSGPRSPILEAMEMELPPLSGTPLESFLESGVLENRRTSPQSARRMEKLKEQSAMEVTF